MSCRLPPPIADRDLLAYLDGEAEEVATHLAQCPYCRQRAEQMASWQQELTARLYRHECPAPLTLGEYHLGLLAGDKADAVGEHLAVCPHCRQEVAGLEAYLHDLEPSLAARLLSEAKERVRVVVARLTSPPGPALAPVYAAVRGEEEALYVYEAEEMQIAVEVQDDAEAPGRKVILGLVTGAAPAGGEATLWRAGQRIAAAPIDELGNFVIGDLEAGSYDLIVSGQQLEVHIEELEVGVS